MRSKLVQYVKQYIEYVKNRTDIEDTTKSFFIREIESHFKYILRDRDPTKVNHSAKRYSDLPEYIWYVPPKILFNIMHADDLEYISARLCAIEDIDNPTDTEMTFLIRNGVNLSHLGLYTFIWGKQKTYEMIFRCLQKYDYIDLSRHCYGCSIDDVIDFLAAIPSKFINSINGLNSVFGIRIGDTIKYEEFDKLCQKNPMYYKKIDMFITDKRTNFYKHIMRRFNLSDTFITCLAIKQCCDRHAVTVTDEAVLKEYAGLVRLYDYNSDTIIDNILESKLKENVK